MAVNIKRSLAQVRGLSKSLAQAHKEQKASEQLEEDVEIEEVESTTGEKLATLLKYTMFACTALVALQILAIWKLPALYDSIYESLHANDFSQAEVFMSNQHPELAPLLKVAKDANGKCKTGSTLRSCYLFLNEDAQVMFKELAYGRKEKLGL